MIAGLVSRILAWLDWAPIDLSPRPRTRRLRATCEFCGKDLAVVRTTGALWTHRCRKEAGHDRPAA